ncbi:hypothetical protein KI387_007368, partial [Taxus chinensis]
MPSLSLFNPFHISAIPATKITTTGFHLIPLSARKTLLAYARGKLQKHIKNCTSSLCPLENYGRNHYFTAKRIKTRVNVSDGISKLTEPEEQSGAKSEERADSVNSSISDTLSLGIKEPTYEVIEVHPSGVTLKKDISRRQLLKSSGLRLRDIRSVDPSLWVTNSVPSILVREQAILLNLGSLRAIAMDDNVLVFDHR